MNREKFFEMDDRAFVRFLRGVYADGGPDYHQEAILRLEHLIAELDAAIYEADQEEDRIHGYYARRSCQECRKAVVKAA